MAPKDNFGAKSCYPNTNISRSLEKATPDETFTLAVGWWLPPHCLTSIAAAISATPRATGWGIGAVLAGTRRFRLAVCGARVVTKPNACS